MACASTSWLYTSFCRAASAALRPFCPRTVASRHILASSLVSCRGSFVSESSVSCPSSLDSPYQRTIRYPLATSFVGFFCLTTSSLGNKWFALAPCTPYLNSDTPLMGDSPDQRPYSLCLLRPPRSPSLASSGSSKRPLHRFRQTCGRVPCPWCSHRVLVECNGTQGLL